MTDFFENFPLVVDKYTNRKLRNITLSVKIPDNIIQNNTLLYPYTVKEGETPTVVAFNYYNDISYVWLIAVANDITDFTSQWSNLKLTLMHTLQTNMVRKQMLSLPFYI